VVKKVVQHKPVKFYLLLFLIILVAAIEASLLNATRSDDGVSGLIPYFCNLHILPAQGATPLTRAARTTRNLASADTLFREADQLRGEWRAESLLLAVRRYRQAAVRWRLAGRKADEARAMRGAACAYLIMGENRRALFAYRRALSLSLVVRDEAGEASALNGIGLAEADLGETETTLLDCGRALLLSKRLGLASEEAQALDNLGVAYYLRSDFDKALEHLSRATVVWEAIGDQRGRAETLLDTGHCYAQRDTRKALACFKEAASLAQAVNDQRVRALALGGAGLMYLVIGEGQMALEYREQAAEILQKVGDRSGEAGALNGAGENSERLGDKGKALRCYLRALDLYTAVGNLNRQAWTMGAVGRMYQALGDTQKAIHYFELLLKLSRRLNDRRMEALTLRDIGGLLTSEGKLRDALSHFRRALPLVVAQQDFRGQASVLFGMARAYELLGDGKEALDRYRDGLSLVRKIEDHIWEASMLYGIAHVQRDLGNLADAYEKIKVARDINDSIRAGVASAEMRTSYVASVYEQYELYIDLLMRMHEQDPVRGRDVTALEACENSRDRSLLESLREAHVDILRGVDQELLKRERDLRRELTDKEERQARLLYAKGSPQQAAAAGKEVEDALGRYQDALADIRAKSPAYAALTQPEPVTLNRLQQQVLEPDTLLLEYSLGEERSYLWVVSRNSIQSYVLPARAEIEAVARSMRPFLTTDPTAQRTPSGAPNAVGRSQERYWQLAARLSQVLLGPVAGQLGNNRLLIVADGILQYIPFSALPRPGQQAAATGANVPLIAEHEIVRAPSASVLALVRRQTADRKPVSGAVAVVADPVFEKDDGRISGAAASRGAGKRGTAASHLIAKAATRQAQEQLGFSRLLFSRTEAEAILALAAPDQEFKALGFDANMTMVRSGRLAGYREVHFATHAILDTDHPELSAIVLSLFDERGKAQAGFLRAHDLYNLDLPVELVVLSACSTALGKDIKGEGIVGMTRGFMYAGAPRIVASLWKVDDFATGELMKLFYEGMLRDGKKPAAALRAAQLTMSAQSRWAAPFYWAAFELQGEWK
jgi:CHAT domain-containing protein